MKCITSPALDDVAIAKYVDGEADETVIAHIKACPYCNERARTWTRLQNHLRKKLYRSTCPDPMELGDYHLGLLPDPQMLVVSAHLRECLLCKREAGVLEDFLNSLDPESGLLGAAKVLVARFMGSQAEQRLAPALRGEAKGPLTFAADGIVIVVDIEPANTGKANILGQIAADDQEQWTGALVELHQDNVVQFSTSVDDLGAFRCEGVMPGPKSLRIISKENSLIVVSNFEVSN